MTRYIYDAAPHVSGELHRAFPDWESLHRFVKGRVQNSAFTANRALIQILAVDVMSRFARGRDCMVVGSLTLPARVDPHLEWPEDFSHAAPVNLEQAHVLSRTAGDLDVVEIDAATREAHARDPAGYGAGIADAIQAIAPKVGGAGLDGLVSYAARKLDVTPAGQVQGKIVATPIMSADSQSRKKVRYVIPIDIKPPDRVRFTGAPEQPYRPYTSLDLPGFHPPSIPMFPTANQLVDKLCAPLDPPRTNRRNIEPSPRVKDLFDAYFLLRTCRIRAESLHAGLVDCAESRGWAGEFEIPYRLYGHRPTPSQHSVDWIAEYGRRQSQDPSLSAYPPFAQVYQTLNQCVTGLAEQRGQEWVPGRGWMDLVPSADAAPRASSLWATVERIAPNQLRVRSMDRRQLPKAM